MKYSFWSGSTKTGTCAGQFVQCSLYLALILLMSGCGFTLRTPPEIQAEYQPMFIKTTEKFNPVYRAMTTKMRGHNVNIASVESTAQALLDIFAEKETQRQTLLTTDAEGERLFVLSWQFRFYGRSIEPGVTWNTLIPDQFVSVSRIVDGAILDKKIGDNYENIRKELRDELAGRIIQQIDTFRLQLL